MLIENVVNIFLVTPFSVSLHNLLDLYIYYINPWNRLYLFLCQSIMSSTSELSHDRQILILSNLLWCCSTHFIVCIKIQSKIHCHDITEILLKVALNTINQPKQNNHVFYIYLDKISAISNMRVKDYPFFISVDESSYIGYHGY